MKFRLQSIDGNSSLTFRMTKNYELKLVARNSDLEVLYTHCFSRNVVGCEIAYSLSNKRDVGIGWGDFFLEHCVVDGEEFVLFKWKVHEKIDGEWECAYHGMRVSEEDCKRLLRFIDDYLKECANRLNSLLLIGKDAVSCTYVDDTLCVESLWWDKADGVSPIELDGKQQRALFEFLKKHLGE